MASRLLNWLKTPEGRQYFFSTHFWGPVANWGLPLAALADMQKDESLISGVMSPTMAGYSTIFMAFAWQVQPRNYLLFACHATNASAQLVQTGRFVNYWYLGGKEKKLEAAPAHAAEQAESKVLSAVKDAEAAVAAVRVSDVQQGLEKAGAHAKEGGEDAVRRGKEIAAEAKRELEVARNYVADALHTTEASASSAASSAAASAQQAEKKGWSLWGSAKASASEEAARAEAQAQQAGEKAKVDLQAIAAHVKEGGEDALRRGREISEEAKRELNEAKDYLPKVDVEKAKKGWFS